MNFGIYKIGDKIILDPCYEEEEASDGNLTLAVIPDNPIKICSMQKGGTIELTQKKFAEMLDMIEKKHKTFFSEIIDKIDESIKKHNK